MHIRTAGLALFWLTGLGRAEQAIQDNSFLIEEAYNQERGVVQHINSFSRLWNSRDWVYSFTQEFPGWRDPRHQFSYSLTGLHAGALPGSGMGLGDVAINYRYQVVGNGESRLAFAPRLSLLAPTGEAAKGRGTGGTGAQINLPLSAVLHRRVVTHWNLGGTLTRNAADALGNRANAMGYNLGQSVVFLARPGLNLLVETSMTSYQAVAGPGRVEWTRACYLNPGIRWAHNFDSGLQIVPGIAMPIGVGPAAGERGLFLYLSFEHPLESLLRRRHR